MRTMIVYLANKQDWKYQGLNRLLNDLKTTLKFWVHIKYLLSHADYRGFVLNGNSISYANFKFLEIHRIYPVVVGREGGSFTILLSSHIFPDGVIRPPDASPLGLITFGINKLPWRFKLCCCLGYLACLRWQEMKSE